MRRRCNKIFLHENWRIREKRNRLDASSIDKRKREKKESVTKYETSKERRIRESKEESVTEYASRKTEGTKGRGYKQI